MNKDNKNQNDENTNEDSSNAADNINEDNDMQAKMDELDYKEIEVEVGYANDKEYEIELEQGEGKPIKAEIEDEINDVFLSGEEAFNELYPMVKKLSINKDTSKDDAIQDILKAFNLDEDYNEFELEITFKDKEKLEYEDQ